MRQRRRPMWPRHSCLCGRAGGVNATLDLDVAIVGAGPGGSTLAALLARRGHSVALIHRDVFPRDKLCGEFLSYDALPIVRTLNFQLHGPPELSSLPVTR